MVTCLKSPPAGISLIDAEPDRSSWGPILDKLESQGDVAIIPYLLHMTYDHWTTHDILAATLPEDLQDELPTGFNPVGHIAHFNLREKYLPRKKLIADVTIDKNAAIRTVINKTESLGDENEFRVLDYELLAGDPNTCVQFNVDGNIFKFDYSKVFWNSRLSTEHQRMVDKFQPGEAICDVMAGVGPFVIPSAKKKAFVFANDLNPDCFHGLKDSIALNKVGSFVHAFNRDGHRFIKYATQCLLDHQYSAKVPIKMSRTESEAKGVKQSGQFKVVQAPHIFSHFVMNLPGTAIDFLPDFNGLYAGQEALFAPHTDENLPMIHCYCFGPKEDDLKENHKPVDDVVCSRVSEKLGSEISPSQSDTEIWDVRDVAPNKRQFCVSFRLPAEVAFRQP